MMVDIDKLKADFERDGIAVVKAFCTPSECEAMRGAIHELVEGWDPSEAISVFRTDSDQVGAQGKDDYFMTSADQIRFFMEPGAINEAGNGLREGLSKHEALNKVGHALHVLHPVFHRYAQSDQLRTLVEALGWTSADLVQSMYIFKQAKIGGEVTPHQDSTFLRTEPLSCLGLWLALQPASEANGCLWARLGSHKEELRRHFCRHPTGDASHPEVMKFKSLSSNKEALVSDGVATPHPATQGFVPLPVEEGDLVLIHGQVDHLSMPNTSEHSRHSFQLHLVEGASAGVAWDPGNWLQYPEGKPFPKFERPGISPLTSSEATA